MPAAAARSNSDGSAADPPSSTASNRRRAAVRTGSAESPGQLGGHHRQVVRAVCGQLDRGEGRPVGRPPRRPDGRPPGSGPAPSVRPRSAPAGPAPSVPGPPSRRWVASAEAISADLDNTTPRGRPVEPEVATTAAASASSTSTSGRSMARVCSRSARIGRQRSGHAGAGQTASQRVQHLGGAVGEAEPVGHGSHRTRSGGRRPETDHPPPKASIRGSSTPPDLSRGLIVTAALDLGAPSEVWAVDRDSTLTRSLGDSPHAELSRTAFDRPLQLIVTDLARPHPTGRSRQGAGSTDDRASGSRGGTRAPGLTGQPTVA